ncbi:uroporphyrinogen-III synthase [Telmatospirillum sp.]|uniref:uroporphyrinogen-III synthase n=1 Tax=Telmatospirillum sp. TaxID=2079197 RepID=UPI00284B7ED7|nr:uroporphyrinogen-III synthase [Telmatospirillum sp.]MDR3439561.1 uroporphyrinogen-III synthase [Telmatospirillum sp.]
MRSGRALVTRPRDDAESIAQALTERGFDVQVEPLLQIVFRHDDTPSLDGVQGFLATSANGVRALAMACPRRDLPLWAVGDSTARCAETLGFRPVESAGGNVNHLAELVTRQVDPKQGALLHAAGSTVAGDLAGILGHRGYEVRRAVLYEAHTADAFSAPLLAALDGQELALALFFSPRTAATFATLTLAAKREQACRAIDAFALSPAVAERLARLPWRQIHVARRPDQAALLAAIDAQAGH